MLWRLVVSTPRSSRPIDSLESSERQRRSTSLRFDEYKDRYRSIKMQRENGILELQFHTNDGPLEWGHTDGPHAEFAEAFADIGRDPENRIVIMTGTGEWFSGPAASK